MKKIRSKIENSKANKLKKHLDFKIEYVYIPSPDAEERLQEAYDILFQGVDLTDLNIKNN